MNHYQGSVPDSPRAANWRDAGLCRGNNNDDWFPSPTNTLAVQQAKNTCFGCPSWIDCAQFALTTSQETGVWGGLSEGQRTTIHKKFTLGQLADRATVERAVYKALRDELDPDRGLKDVWEERTYNLPGGHMGWRGSTSALTFRGRVLTPNQISFIVHRGRNPEGIVRRTCEDAECVGPWHLADGRERDERAKAARKTAEAAASVPVAV